MIVIKLGGSVITDKTRYKVFHEDVMKQILHEFTRRDVVVVHGAGSFGHVMAEKLKILKNADPAAVSLIHRDVTELNLRVMDVFYTEGFPCISFAPHCFINNEKNIFRCFSEYMDNGIIPVTYGDIYVKDSVAKIISGDDLVYDISKVLNPEKVIFVTDVDGIYDKNPKIHPDAKKIELFDDFEMENLNPDVTGGMKKKIETMRKMHAMGMNVSVVNGFERGALKREMDTL